MSFTTFVLSELLDASLAKTCCRKSMLYGMLFGADFDDLNCIRAELKTNQSAQMAAQIFKKQFSIDACVNEITRAGRTLFNIEAKSKAISSFLSNCDNSQLSLSELVGFRCPECAHSFLRGVFIVLGTVNDPKSGYHLEISIMLTQ